MGGSGEGEAEAQRYEVRWEDIGRIIHGGSRDHSGYGLWVFMAS